MAELFRMPAVSADDTAGVLSAWQVAEGAAFAADDALICVETDKAEVEVPAERPGVLLKTLYEPGTEIEVGTPVAVIGAPDESVGDLDALLAELGVAPAAGADVVRPERRTVPDAPAPDALIPDSPAPRTPVPPAPPAAEAGAAPGARLFSSPLARRLAREAGLELAELTGTGPGGRIVRRDVEAAVAARRNRPEPSAPPREPADRAASPAPARVQDPAGSGHQDIPHTRMRRAIAARLTESKQHTPHFYLRATCEVDELLAFRQRINAASPVKVSINDILVKAAALAHTAVPEMNATWHADAVRRYESVDVSIAVSADRGLLTPVLRGVERMSLSAVATATRDRAERARSGTLRQADLEGGSLTISNLGMYGVEEFAAIINPPQAAILAVGAVRDEAVVRDGAVTAVKAMTVVLSVDHRPVDGAVAARWLAAFTGALADPMRIVV
ncbi:pyruvate dehydrogenase complex dihydrolipoamide acetyltransferase [Kitasatospora putterlickiae]|uniref:Dihydrolipoamide acetyltransferase component of pyruvate dehydrogenase complex n=1 Tax=Kitasatospora putterlickiae TaxID=221725 RepID=A0ABP4IAR1_9ACTN